MVQYQVNASEINGVAVSGTPSEGEILTAESATAADWQTPASLPLLAMQATTGAAGYTKVDSTGTVISWTAPNDGNIHRVLLMYSQHCTSAETGGAMTITTTTPDGGSHGYAIESGGAGTGFSQGSNTTYIIEADSTVTVSQSSALSVGATVFWAEIWAA